MISTELIINMMTEQCAISHPNFLKSPLKRYLEHIRQTLQNKILSNLSSVIISLNSSVDRKAFHAEKLECDAI